MSRSHETIPKICEVEYKLTASRSVSRDLPAVRTVREALIPIESMGIVEFELTWPRVTGEGNA